MMRKIITILLLISTVFLLNSCSLVEGKGVIYDDTNQKADARFEQVVKAISNNDTEALKKMFSEKALKSSNDFNGNAKSLFDFIQGPITSWKSTGSYDGSEGMNADGTGNYTKEVDSYYYATVGKQEYFFLLTDCFADTNHPDNVGLYLLLVVKAEDRLKVYDGSQKILFDGDNGNKPIPRAGIYLPFK